MFVCSCVHAPRCLQLYGAVAGLLPPLNATKPCYLRSYVSFAVAGCTPLGYMQLSGSAVSLWANPTLLPHNGRRRRLSNSILHSQWPFLGGQAMSPPLYLTLYSALHQVTCFLGASRSHRFLTTGGVDGSVTISPTPDGSFWEAKLCPPHGI